MEKSASRKSIHGYHEEALSWKNTFKGSGVAAEKGLVLTASWGWNMGLFAQVLVVNTDTLKIPEQRVEHVIMF